LDTKPAPHPTDQTLNAYRRGKLDDASAESVNAHLKRCRDCRQRVAAIASDTGLRRPRHAQQVQAESPPPVGSSFVGLSGLNGGPGSPVPPAAEPLPPGRIDNPDYEIIRELGRGGMGVVHLAYNKLMGRKEVLKVVSGNLLDRSMVRERFLREIRSAAQLHHPNIVTAYSAMRAGDRIILAMEYIEGYDLAELVKAQGPLAVAHACNFAYQAAQGLQYAHERGMVHRDIKPGNLMLIRQGKRAVIKILDFGLAKATQESPVDGGLTREGQMLGTPDYIAPEQSLDAQKADIRADIYSLGCTLYYLLTGAPPFAAKSLYEILQGHHSRDALPLNLARPEVPAELADLVAKMMAKAPEHRFQTPGDVARALRPFFRPEEAGPVGRTDRVASPVGGAVADRVTAATPPPVAPVRPPSPVVGQQGSPMSRVPARDLIDLGQEQRLAPESTTRREGGGTVPSWLWPSVAAAAVLVGLGLAWRWGVAAGQKEGSGLPGPTVAVRSEEGARRAEEGPRVAKPLLSDARSAKETARQAKAIVEVEREQARRDDGRTWRFELTKNARPQSTPVEGLKDAILELRGRDGRPIRVLRRAVERESKEPLVVWNNQRIFFDKLEPQIKSVDWGGNSDVVDWSRSKPLIRRWRAVLSRPPADQGDDAVRRQEFEPGPVEGDKAPGASPALECDLIPGEVKLKLAIDPAQPGSIDVRIDPDLRAILEGDADRAGRLAEYKKHTPPAKNGREQDPLEYRRGELRKLRAQPARHEDEIKDMEREIADLKGIKAILRTEDLLSHKARLELSVVIGLDVEGVGILDIVRIGEFAAGQ
jgi:serine/threonine protein kinase